MGDHRKPIESVLFGVPVLPTALTVNLISNGKTHNANVAWCMPVLVTKTKVKCEGRLPKPSTSQATLTKNKLVHYFRAKFRKQSKLKINQRRRFVRCGHVAKA